MKNIALIFAGGVGSRMGASIPKQFLEVSNKPIIIHTLELFEINQNIDEIYVGCIEEYIPDLKEMIKRFSVNKIKKIYPGGNSGQDTIFRGLCAIKEDLEEEDAIVLIHDGVRPLVNQETIDNVVRDATEFGSSVTSTPAFETPLISYDGERVAEMPERKNVYTAQAPQAFRLDEIISWHLNEREQKGENAYENIVDSCGLAMANGISPHLTIGNRGNIKVTTNEDFLTLVSNNLAHDFGKFMELEDIKKKKNNK